MPDMSKRSLRLDTFSQFFLRQKNFFRRSIVSRFLQALRQRRQLCPQFLYIRTGVKHFRKFHDLVVLLYDHMACDIFNFYRKTISSTVSR